MEPNKVKILGPKRKEGPTNQKKLVLGNQNEEVNEEVFKIVNPF